MTEPARKKSAEDRIIDAAVQSIAELGVRKTTANSIASRADVSRMTVYRQFGDIRTTVRVALERIIHEDVEQIALGGRYAHERERIVVECVAAVQALGTGELLESLREHDSDFFLPYVLQRLSGAQLQLQDRIIDAIRGGLADGSVREVVPERAAFTVLMLCTEYVVGARIVAARSDAAQCYAELGEAIDRYLRPDLG